MDFIPDRDAQPIDRAVMALARQLQSRGHTEAAQNVLASAAVLRETPRQTDETANALALHDALIDMVGAASHIAESIAAHFPEEIDRTLRAARNG